MTGRSLRLLLTTLDAAAVVASAPAVDSLAAAPGQPQADAAATWRLCKKKIKHKGKRYKVARLRLSCPTARHKSKRVLKTRHAPHEWKCSLDLPFNGTCHKGKRAFWLRRV
jgi:hypothetical protein